MPNVQKLVATVARTAGHIHVGRLLDATPVVDDNG
jgi:hypothetical protein